MNFTSGRVLRIRSRGERLCRPAPALAALAVLTACTNPQADRDTGVADAAVMDWRGLPYYAPVKRNLRRLDPVVADHVLPVRHGMIVRQAPDIDIIVDFDRLEMRFVPTKSHGTERFRDQGPLLLSRNEVAGLIAATNVLWSDPHLTCHVTARPGTASGFTSITLVDGEMRMSFSLDCAFTRDIVRELEGRIARMENVTVIR